jgi:hypothetical protein
MLVASTPAAPASTSKASSGSVVSLHVPKSASAVAPPDVRVSVDAVYVSTETVPGALSPRPQSRSPTVAGASALSSGPGSVSANANAQAQMRKSTTHLTNLNERPKSRIDADVGMRGVSGSGFASTSRNGLDLGLEMDVE